MPNLPSPPTACWLSRGPRGTDAGVCYYALGNEGREGVRANVPGPGQSVWMMKNKPCLSGPGERSRVLFRLCPVPFAVSTSARQLSGCVHRPPRGASPERRGSRRAFPRPFPWELAAGLRWPRSLVISRTRQEAEAQRGSGASGKLGSDPPSVSLPGFGDTAL